MEQKQKYADFIRRSVRELLPPNFKNIQGKTYNSGKMNPMKNAAYLIKETDKLLFQNGEQYFRNIMDDEYQMSKGTEEAIKIVREFVNWTDLDNRY